MINQNHQITIVTPVYEDLESLQCLLADIKKIKKYKIYVVVVDDGSLRKPIDEDIFSKFNIEGSVLNLNANYGHQIALYAGLKFVANRKKQNDVAIITMDSDGEDNPKNIEVLVDELLRTNSDCMVAKRGNRHENLKFKAYYFIYKITFMLLTGVHINFGNFVALSPKVLNRLLNAKTLSLHYPATLIKSKLNIGSISIDRERRYFGVSKMNGTSLFLHGFRSLSVFSEEILIRIGVVTVIFAIFTLIAIPMLLTVKFLGHPAPGWTSILMGLIFIILLQMAFFTLFCLLLLSGNAKFNGHLDELFDKSKKTLNDLNDMST